MRSADKSRNDKRILYRIGKGVEEMTLQERIKLIDAGYTKEEISQLDNTTAAAATSATTPTEETARTETQPAAPKETGHKNNTDVAAAAAPAAAQPAAPAAPAAPADGISAVLAEMARTLQQMQAANIAASSNPGPKTAEEETKTILANVIAPPKKGK